MHPSSTRATIGCLVKGQTRYAALSASVRLALACPRHRTHGTQLDH
jgi:hypothetical protein